MTFHFGFIVAPRFFKTASQLLQFLNGYNYKVIAVEKKKVDICLTVLEDKL